MMTDFAPKMIIHLAPGHSDISKMRFWENVREQEVHKKVLSTVLFALFFPKAGACHFVFGKNRSFLGIFDRFWGIFGEMLKSLVQRRFSEFFFPKIVPKTIPKIRFLGIFGDFAIHFTGGFADEKEKLQREM